VDNHLIRVLQELVPKNELVIQPDHPLLLRSPDALVGGEANLCAIFTPQRIEERNPAHLASRLMAARLALPQHCRTLLLLQEVQEDRMAKLSDQFGLVAAANDKTFGKFVQDRGDFGGSRAMSPEIQERANRVFEVALYVSENAYRNSRVVGHTSAPCRGAGDRIVQRRRRRPRGWRSPGVAPQSRGAWGQLGPA
jgi:hypothetical protein